MRKTLSFLAVVLSAALLTAGCAFFQKDEAAPVGTAGPQATLPMLTPTPTEPTYQSLTGVVCDYSDETFSLALDDGTVVMFARPAEGEESRVFLNNTVTVEYSGCLEEAENVISAALSGEKKTRAAIRAGEIIRGMTLEEQVGQMFIARCPSAQAAAKAAEYSLGGYILFKRDFTGKSAAEVQAEIQSYQAAAKLPMLIGVDEEGGTVNRVSSNPQLRKTPFLSPQELYKQGGWEGIQKDTVEKCRLLQSLGINLNLAPVCDVSVDEKDYMYKRSFGQDAQTTAFYVKTVVEQMHAAHMGSALKHFPGYGNNADTHTGMSIDRRPYETFVQADFLPFSAGIEAGAGAVLVSHNIVECMDASVPASLSKNVHQVLREELGFTGVIMTDDLYMDAIKKYTGDREAAVAAVLAGNDMLCCTDFEQQIPAVLEAVRSGMIQRQQIEQSAERVLLWKIELGILS